METVETEGDSIDAAIDSALETLGVTRNRVSVEILNDASRGFLGLGGRKARVRVRVRPSIEEIEPRDESSVAAPEADFDAGSDVDTGRDYDADVEPEADSEVDSEEEEAPTDRMPIDADVVERARDVLQTIVDFVDVGARVRASEDGDHISLEIDGDSSGLLIGRKGQMLDALEYMVTRIVACDEHRTVHVVVDSQGYRSRRQESLEELARRMAGEAKRRRRAVTLNPMSPRDRRIVHLALQQESGLTTRSSGQGHYRKLVIIPDGAPRSGRSGRG